MSDIDGYLAQLLSRAHHAVHGRLEQALAGEGVQVEHWKVLRVLADEQGHAMGEVAQALTMHPPTLTKLVDRMISQGLAMRSPDLHDNRRVLLYATDQGLALSKRLNRLVQQHEDGIVRSIGAARAKQLKALLAELGN
ncbi:MarR family transcriptional regulator [Cupriavidus basilensis]|uniref:MarR family transcriptional regulator n=1 Tax=Cupriavidus basilensis TaxID=68895 RepID=A0ABT6AYQ5_9BURK|nr:MarR family transcriptional regulator [Cupriavidus basilensis]MDF3837493.1 MarR family transcriptional regulator [Cupriavidus basilensis]